LCTNTSQILDAALSLAGWGAGVSKGDKRLSLEAETIADVFSATGYRTVAFGKWHVCMQLPWNRICCGFCEIYGFCSGHCGHYFSLPLDNNARVRRQGIVPVQVERWR
jgi:arylsulfatase A-like enzyme